MKTILTDIDGVCLDWEHGFEKWIAKRGYTFDDAGIGHFGIAKRYNIEIDNVMDLITQFNESAAGGFLKPLRDSAYYIKRLHDEWGYKFTAITSFGNEEHSVKLREINLKTHFGNVFDDVICLPLGGHKEDALKEYANTGHWWIEDHPSNAAFGRAVGLRSVLMRHDYNQGHDVGPSAFPMVDNWKQLYSLITGENS